jgi:hypothetical protein
VSDSAVAPSVYEAVANHPELGACSAYPESSASHQPSRSPYTMSFQSTNSVTSKRTRKVSLFNMSYKWLVALTYSLWHGNSLFLSQCHTAVSCLLERYSRGRRSELHPSIPSNSALPCFKNDGTTLVKVYSTD